ncbi:unnamed protein product [Adineta ricciae]|uniref:Uncharacterized protein n=1 Tax=Adineta ricciae TaxID=249248 RepID=A0A814VNQ7_ADIRI|nr:unnamed protein product [Adineta ricciae]CAF1665417.1 unnamed protein product [Adineta ricciae]
MTVARTATTLLFIVCSCMSSTEAQREYVYTLNTTFKINVFIPYYTQYGMDLMALENNDIAVSNTSFIVFNLTNGILTSPVDGANYYLKNQTGVEFPSYVLKRGKTESTSDVSLFRSTPVQTWVGRHIGPNITMTEQPGADNLWIACMNPQGIYVIGWDPDSTHQPPKRCVNYAKYNPGVLLHVADK